MLRARFSFPDLGVIFDNKTVPFFFFPFNKYILSTKYGAGSVTDVKDTAVSKTESLPLGELKSHREERQVNK